MFYVQILCVLCEYCLLHVQGCFFNPYNSVSKLHKSVEISVSSQKKNYYIICYIYSLLYRQSMSNILIFFILILKVCKSFQKGISIHWNYVVMPFLNFPDCPCCPLFFKLNAFIYSNLFQNLCIN